MTAKSEGTLHILEEKGPHPLHHPPRLRIRGAATSTMVAASMLSVTVCLVTAVRLSEAATGSAEWSYSGKDGEISL